MKMMKYQFGELSQTIDLSDVDFVLRYEQAISEYEEGVKNLDRNIAPSAQLNQVCQLFFDLFDCPWSSPLNKEPIKQVEQQVKSIRPERPKITPISKSRKQANGMEVCVIKPTSIEDEIEITDTLLNGRTVIINMEGIDIELAQRIIDFTSGSTYAIHGNLQKISTYIFLATPSGIDISGDIQNIMETFSLTGLTV